jgi:hypothetical protein
MTIHANSAAEFVAERLGHLPRLSGELWADDRSTGCAGLPSREKKSVHIYSTSTKNTQLVLKYLLDLRLSWEEG